MSVHRVYQKVERTPEQVAELRAVRESYQKAKPTLEQVEAESGQEALPLWEVVALHQILARLKREREAQRLTLAQMAERTGIDQAALSRLENGHTPNPTVGTIARIAAALGKVIECVLQDAPRPPTLTPA